MHPVLFEHAYGAVNAYGMLILLGTLASMPGAWWDVKNRGFGGKEPLQFFLDLYIVLFVGTIVGGRVLHVLTAPGAFFEDPSQLLSLNSSGFVFFGSFFGILTGLWWLARKYDRPTGAVVDLFVPWPPIAHLGGRLGCFAAGCCFGAPWEGSWAVAFPHDSIVYLTEGAPLDGDHTVPLHPVQLYEALGLGGLATWLAVTRIQPGSPHPWRQASRYALGYGGLRFVVELLRGDAERGYVFEVPMPGLAEGLGMHADHVFLLSTSQTIGIALIGLGVWGIWRLRRDG